MKNRILFNSLLAAVCVSLQAGGAKASVPNGDEAFAGSLAPAALAALELPKAAQPAILPLPTDPFLYLSECRIVDAQFIRQPSIPEAVKMLSGCMKQISAQYGVKVNVSGMVTVGPAPAGAQGGSLSAIHIDIPGRIPEGNPVMKHLAGALKGRNDRLFGHRVVLSASRTGSANELSDRAADPVLGPLKAAVDSAQKKPLVDYGYYFGLTKYPANTKLIKIYADVAGYNESDIDPKMFNMSSGDAAVRVFVKYLKDEAASENENQVADSPVIVKEVLNMAAAAEKAFLGNKRFAKVQTALHTRTEDGDMDYLILMAQEKDGSIQVLNYTRNPY